MFFITLQLDKKYYELSTLEKDIVDLFTAPNYIFMMN